VTIRVKGRFASFLWRQEESKYTPFSGQPIIESREKGVAIAQWNFNPFLFEYSSYKITKSFKAGLFA
jgi:hypothetical protein